MKFLSAMGLLLSITCCIHAENSFRLIFTQQNFNTKKQLPKNWHFRGKIGTDKPIYSIAKDAKTGKECLRITTQVASGTILHDISGVLSKYPVMRWKWKVNTYPPGADGRREEVDDQAVAIYVGSGGFFSNHSVAYRWETETPKGFEGKVKYAGGLAKVNWITLRNKTDGKGKWIVEERNVAEDLKKLFDGKVPKEVVVSISANSQYTKSNSQAEVEYIEFLPAPLKTDSKKK